MRNLRVCGAAACWATFVGWLLSAPGSLAQHPATKPAAAAPTTQRVVVPEVGFAIEMIRLPAGRVTVTGRDGQPAVRAVKAIWIAKYEARWAEYTPYFQRLDLPRNRQNEGADAQSRPSRPYHLPHFKGENYPACGASYLSAKNYCAWLSRLTGKRFRLPTEAEWEFACRAGDRAHPADPKSLSAVAWYEENSDGEPHEVGTRRANAFGLHDTLGNVAEWVVRDAGADSAVVAGGSMVDPASETTPAARQAYSPEWQRNDPAEPKSRWWMCNGFHVGFRVVMED